MTSIAASTLVDVPLPLRVPRTPRELLRLLSLVGRFDDLDAWLGRLDLQQVTATHIDQIVQRGSNAGGEAAGTEGPIAAEPQDGDPSARLAAAIRSDRFQNDILPYVLDAFPDLVREIYIHIPRCAGADLIQCLAPMRLSLARELEDPARTTKDMLLRLLARFVPLAEHYDAVFVHGDFTLGALGARFSLRAQDRVFTVIREPLARMVSLANGMVDRLRQDPQGLAAETRETLAQLGLARVPGDLGGADLAERLLRDPRICPPDAMCRQLCDGAEATSDAALAAVIRSDIEITTTALYDRWLVERWGVAERTRQNRSEPHLSRWTALASCGEVVRDAAAEDVRFYEVIAWALRQTGATSIRGQELGRLIGLRSARALDAVVAADRPAEADDPDSLLRARGDDAVGGHIRDWLDRPAALLPAADTAAELFVRFGSAGNAAVATRTGWSPPEPGYTWTVGHRSTLVLPRPAPADVLLQIQLAPFVHAERLARQRLRLLANGRPVAAVAVCEHAVLAVELPASLLAAGSSLELAFEMPDAARPVDVSGVEDDRLLGFALHRLLLTPVRPPAPPAETALPYGTAVVPLPPQALMLRFESLGENCEFGLVQRRCGAEPLGLLRFASAPLPKLLAALRTRFRGVGWPENIVVELSATGREYMVHDRAFGFNYHAWVNLGEQRPVDIHAREVGRVPFLVRKLIEDLTTGEKIFVYHAVTPPGVATAHNLAAVLRSYGPTTLLWVELADAAHPAGTVERVGEGLVKGYLDRFAPGEDANDLSLEGWIEICNNAVCLP
jgi:hypothetical protein